MPLDLGLMSAIPLFAGTQRAPRDDASTQFAHGPETWLARIAVRSLGRIAIVAVQDIVRLEAEDNYVRIWANRMYLHKQTLTRLTARLDPADFLRVHRSHTVNLRLVRELRPQLHGEFHFVLANGAEITSGRSYRAAIQRAFGLGKPPLA